MSKQRGYVFKLKPSKRQEEKFLQFAGASRWIWNRALDIVDNHHLKTGEHLSPFVVAKDLLKWKRSPETSWLSTIHSQVLQQPFRDLNDAISLVAAGLADTLNACGEDVRPGGAPAPRADLCEAGTSGKVLAPAI